MFKKILCFFLAVSLAVCLVCPTAFADDATSEHTHDWVDLTPALKIEGKVHDLECSVSVKQCSICKFYDHKISLAGYTYDYIAATASPGFEGILQNLAMKLYASIFGNNSAATKAPSGIGRKDLPGYSDNNVPEVSQSGQLHFYAPVTCWGITGSTNNYWISSGAPELVKYNTKDCEGSSFSSESKYSSWVARAICTFTAPVSGTYYIYKDSLVADYYWRFSSSDDWKKQSLSFKATKSASFNKGEDGYVSVSTSVSVPLGFNAKGYGVDIYVSPLTSTINKQTNITINNNTWNGNIYTDNSTNLTYIYPEYTTINENNETVTNISTNPIIYNNETKKYYTYDTVTNNYYYITYEEPKPSATPAPTWTPGGGATRGGGVGRHPSDTDAADWTLHYYILNNRRYDAYYALKKTEVDTETKLPWVDNKKYISTTQIPIANGQYTVSVPDGVYWRVWSWDEASQTLTGVNSSNWHSTINNFLFNATGEYIFEFCKADGSDFNTAKDVTLKLKNDKITDYEDGGTIVEEPTPSPSPEPTETPSPTEPPTPTATPTPGGGTVPTPGGGTSGGNSGNNSNISGGDDEGLFGWLWDLLKDLVKAILKAIFKVLSGILGFLIWLVERVGLLFPFLPAPAVAALGAGVVLVFVIKIIRFIRG